jgi:hypothetical protein
MEQSMRRSLLFKNEQEKHKRILLHCSFVANVIEK